MNYFINLSNLINNFLLRVLFPCNYISNISKITHCYSLNHIYTYLYTFVYRYYYIYCIIYIFIYITDFQSITINIVNFMIICVAILIIFWLYVFFIIYSSYFYYNTVAFVTFTYPNIECYPMLDNLIISVINKNAILFFNFCKKMHNLHFNCKKRYSFEYL